MILLIQTQAHNTNDQSTTSPIVISNRNQVMQFVQISQPAQVIATSSSNVNKVQTRSVAKGVIKGTVRGPYKKKNQENIENIK